MKKIEASLIAAFAHLNRFLQGEKIRYCLIGGMAAGYWGEPRFTRDMDFTVTLNGGLEKLRRKLKAAGFSARTKGASQLQVTAYQKLRFQADIILSEIEYQEWVIQRSQIVPMFNFQVPICSAEDLIILKLIANRRQDLLDIEKILERQESHLDKNYLKEWIRDWSLQERWQKEFSQKLNLF